MTYTCPREFVVLAERLADAAGDVLRRRFRRPMTITDKADESPVTHADREAEARMRELIAGQFRDHGILGEEFGPDRSDAEFVWVLDPIDGTKAFISGVPVFGTLIALMRSGTPVLGVIDQPVSRERWLGADGYATTLNGSPAQVAPRGDLADAVLWATSPHMFEGDPAGLAAVTRLREAVKFVHYGGECYQYGMLASGFIDIVVEDDMRAYDYCALVPVVRGAGGMITDWGAVRWAYNPAAVCWRRPALNFTRRRCGSLRYDAMTDRLPSPPRRWHDRDKPECGRVAEVAG